LKSTFNRRLSQSRARQLDRNSPEQSGVQQLSADHNQQRPVMTTYTVSM